MSLFLFLSLLLPLAAPEVLQYTDGDFSERISAHPTSLVMFFAPWCGHCKHLKPEFESAARQLADEPRVALVKVDCTESGKETCDRYEVEGYPTLKVFRGGKAGQDYTGPREAAAIVEYMRTQTEPKMKKLDREEEVVKFREGRGDAVAVVAFFEEGSPAEKVFRDVAADMYEGVKFAYSSAEPFLNARNNSLTLFRPPLLKSKFEEEAAVLEEIEDQKRVEEFIRSNRHGLVGIRTHSNREDFRRPSVVAYFRIDHERNPKGTKYLRNRVLKVAAEYKGKVSFAVSDKIDFQGELMEYGLENTEKEPIVVAINTDKKKFVMKTNFSAENFKEFVEDFLQDKLVPTIKSEEVPLVNDGPVKVAVAKNFAEVVVDNGKDTLVEFYAPWCGHCKKLAPIYEELGKKLVNEEVEVVKMDVIANEVPSEFEVKEYPSLYWLKRDEKKKPVLYRGNKELEDLLKFVAKEATEELKGFDRGGKVKKGSEKKEEL